MGGGCEYGQLKVQKLEEGMGYMEKKYDKLESRFYNLVIGAAGVIILQLVNLIVVLWKK